MISTAQEEVRKIENDSSASLRDVKRFVLVLQFYLEFQEFSGKSSDAIIITTMICYVLRIATQAHKD